MSENLGLLEAKVQEHDKRLDKHDEQISNIQVSSGKFETKLDITNKILGAIAIMIGGGIVTFFFTIFTGLIK